jgi:hypothetical protein
LPSSAGPIPEQHPGTRSWGQQETNPCQAALSSVRVRAEDDSRLRGDAQDPEGTGLLGEERERPRTEPVHRSSVRPSRPNRQLYPAVRVAPFLFFSLCNTSVLSAALRFRNRIRPVHLPDGPISLVQVHFQTALSPSHWRSQALVWTCLWGVHFQVALSPIPSTRATRSPGLGAPIPTRTRASYRDCYTEFTRGPEPDSLSKLSESFGHFD